jgi:hypothetical protein
MDGYVVNIEKWWGGWRKAELFIRAICQGVGAGLLKMRGSVQQNYTHPHAQI